jgi:hypothetical protein
LARIRILSETLVLSISLCFAEILFFEKFLRRGFSVGASGGQLNPLSPARRRHGFTRPWRVLVLESLSPFLQRGEGERATHGQLNPPATAMSIAGGAAITR